MSGGTADAAYGNAARSGGSAGAGLRARPRIWLRRYLPAEAVATSAALAAALAAARGGTGTAVAAAAWAETLAFYAFVTARELRAGDAWRSLRGTAAAARGVVSEFGAAEAFDTLVVRPLLMYAFVALLGSLLLGAAAGKLVADVVFYALAIPAYELRVRTRR
jgi:hypothetical protein